MATSNKIYARQIQFDVCLPFYYSNLDNENDDSKNNNYDNGTEFCIKSNIIKLYPFEFCLEVHPKGYGEENINYMSVFLVNTASPPIPKDLKDYRVSYSITLLNVDEKDNERLPKKGYTTHGFRSQVAWGYRRFIPLDDISSRKFLVDDSLLKFRVTIKIEVDDYDFDRYIIKDNDDDYCIVNDFVPINSSNGIGLG